MRGSGTISRFDWMCRVAIFSIPRRVAIISNRPALLTIPQNRFGCSSYGPWTLDQLLDRPLLHVLRIWHFLSLRHDQFWDFGPYVNVQICARKFACILKVKQEVSYGIICDPNILCVFRLVLSRTLSISPAKSLKKSFTYPCTRVKTIERSGRVDEL
jgi:hypothetical protein